MSTWNGNNFSVYNSDEMQVLKLIKILGDQVNHNTDNKTDKTGDHSGTWQGISKPTLSEEGMRGTVEKHETDIIGIKTNFLKLSNKIVYFEGIADGSYSAGTGTDNTLLLQSAIDNLSLLGGGVLKIPHGIYKVTESIKIPSGVSIEGDGKWSTIIFCPIEFTDTDGLFHINGSGGYPTNLKGMAILCQSGGCLGTGILSTKNGVFMSDLWVNGFQYGIMIKSTDNFLSDFAIELCSPYGLVLNSSHINVENGTVYGCQIGVTIGNSESNEEGEITIVNVRANYCGQTGFEVVSNSKHVTFIGCSVNDTSIEKFTSSAFKIANSKDIKIIGCDASIKTGKSLTAKGIEAISSNDIIIQSFKCYGWLDGISLDSCGNVIVSSSACFKNGRNGIKVNAGDRVNINGNNCIENGSTGETDSGIYLNNSSGYALFSVTNNIITQNGGGVQKYGIYSQVVENGDSSGFTNMIGNVIRFNSIMAMMKAGKVANSGTEINVLL